MNLAPADLRKEGPAYDLPIAVGILMASRTGAGTGRSGPFSRRAFRREAQAHAGNLADGRPRAGARIQYRLCTGTRMRSEASLVDGVHVVPVESPVKRRIFRHWTRSRRSRTRRAAGLECAEPEGTDFRHIRGQEHVKRALEVAAAGGTTLSWSDRRAPANVAGAGDLHDAARDDYG